MKFLGTWYISFGIFLILSGFAGFASNPEEAQTALISGSFFGAMMLVSGFLISMGFAWARILAVGITFLLVGAFSWRATAGWQDVMAGQPKVFAASLITAMLVASLVTLFVAFRFWNYKSAD